MNKQTFEIIDGVYVGPSIWEGALDLIEYKGTLTLTSLGPLKEVRGDLYLFGCTILASLGSLREVGGILLLNGCTNLVSLGSLKKVRADLWLKGCTSLTSLGSLTEVGGYLQLGGRCGTLQEVQEKIRYYSSLPLHEALNALLTDEVQDMPLYKNILLQTLQGVSG